jgi:hypothetical protein
MKTTKVLVVSLILGALSLQACKKKTTTAETPAATTPTTPVVTPLTPSFYAKVGGVEHVENIYSAMVSSNKIIIVASANSGFPSMGLQLPIDIVPGTYTLSSPFGGTYVGLYNTSNSINNCFSAGGSNPRTVTITSHDQVNNQITGTFLFTAVPNFGSTSTATYTITEGSFAANY